MLTNGKANLSEEFYLKWLNDQLSKCSPPLLVFDLVEDNICNGVAIGLLLEVVGRIKMDGLLLQPITVVERLHNIHEVFTVLRRFEVKLNNIQPEDIMSGDHETVLQLLTAINSHFGDKPRYGRRSSTTSNNEFKFDNSGRNSAWSMSSGSRRTPIRRSPSGQPLSKSREIYSTNPVPYSDYMWSNDQSSNLMRTSYFTNNQTQLPDHIDKSDTLSPKPKNVMNSAYFNRSGSPKSIYGRREISQSVTPTNTNMNTQSILRSQNYSNNLSNNSRNYGHQTSPMRNENSNDEIPQFLDPMDEINYLRAQLKSLSRLIESEGSDAIRTSSDLRSQASRCTQTEVAVLLDRHAKRANAELSDLKRLMRSKEASIQHLEAENARLNESIQNLMKVINKHENVNSTNGSTQNINNNNSSNGPVNYNYPNVGMDNRLLESSHKTELYQSNFIRNTEPHVNQQRLTNLINHSSPERFYSSTSYKSPERVISPERQASPSRLISPGRQLSPTSKRFPHYAPYIHSITRSTSRSPERHKSPTSDMGYMKKTTFSFTPNQSQIVKSPTQRLLMQNLTSTTY